MRNRNLSINAQQILPTLVPAMPLNIAPVQTYPIIVDFAMWMVVF